MNEKMIVSSMHRSRVPKDYWSSIQCWTIIGLPDLGRTTPRAPIQHVSSVSCLASHPSQQFPVMSYRNVLGWTSTKARINVSCSRTLHSDASEAQTRSPSVSSQALLPLSPLKLGWGTAFNNSLGLFKVLNIYNHC